jgi:thioesterase domain-containing protein
MLSDAQRALIAARLRRGRTDTQEGTAGDAAVRSGTPGPLVELAGGGGGEAAALGRLFLVHAIGGTVHPYAPLAALLCADFGAVYGIEAAGLAAGSAPAASLDAMADAYLGVIRTAQPGGGPYRLSGWSMGGLVAYELARRLERDGEKVESLILLDPPFAMPAELSDEEPGDGEPGGARRIAAWFVADATRTLGPGGDPAEAAPDPVTSSAAEQLDWLARRLDAAAGPLRSAGLADAVRTEIGRRFEVFRAHARLIAGYRPPAPLRTRTLLVSARHSPNAAVTRQWRDLLGPAAVTVQAVDCDHYAFLRAPLVAQVAAGIRTWQGAR